MLSIKQLKEQHQECCPHSIFFDELTLLAFGESLSHMRVLDETVLVKDRFGVKHRAYVVESVRFETERVHYYFDTDSFRLVNPQRY